MVLDILSQDILGHRARVPCPLREDFMLHIYLTRHGETEWNKENRLQGWRDSNLTEKGINNALKLGERLNETSFNAIYSSPSGRAFQTAKYVRLERDIPIITDKDLREIFLGEWEGKTREEIEADYKTEYFHFWNAPEVYDHEPHQAEGLVDFKKRVEGAVRRVIEDNPSGNILIVTHAVVIKAIISYVKDVPTEKMWDPPFIHGTSLSLFNWDGEKFEVQLLGDTSHMEVGQGA